MVSLCDSVPQRFVMATMFLLALTVQYIDRLSFDLAVSVVSEKERPRNKKENGSCPLQNGTGPYFPFLKTEFYWTPYEEADLASGFFFGYIITSLPGGTLSDLYGPKRVMGVGIIVSGVCVLLTPLCAGLTGILFINRIVLGLAQGPMFPSLSAFIARWVVPEERNLASAYINIAISSGGISSILVTKFILINSKTWDPLFYYVGGFTLLFSLAWFPLTHDSPEDRPWITDEELDKINDGLRGELNDPLSPLPVAALLKSWPAWAMIIANIGHVGIFYVLGSLTPLYMDRILRRNCMDNAMMSCLPYLLLVAISISSTLLADFLIRRGYLSETNQCKIWLAIANIVPSVFVIFGSSAGCNYRVAALFFIVAFGFMGFASSSIWIVNVKMAPNLAGRLMGLMNGIGCILGLVGPRLEAFIIEQQSAAAWRFGFLCSFFMATVTTIFFLIFGSADLQLWNKLPVLPFWSGVRSNQSGESGITNT